MKINTTMTEHENICHLLSDGLNETINPTSVNIRSYTRISPAITGIEDYNHPNDGLANTYDMKVSLTLSGDTNNIYNMSYRRLSLDDQWMINRGRDSEKAITTSITSNEAANDTLENILLKKIKAAIPYVDEKTSIEITNNESVPITETYPDAIYNCRIVSANDSRLYSNGISLTVTMPISD